MRRMLLPLFVLLAAGSAAAESADWTVTPYGDLRVRQEKLDGVYHFAPDPDRNWIRVRTRLGAELAGPAHRFEVRLANEHRHYLDPDDVDFDWNELIVDRLAWTWSVDERTRITVGRQDIIWPGGFLMLEGHPLDGSRSIYHNAVRARVERCWGKLDVSLIANPQQDDFVLAGDEDLNLTQADEIGAAARYERGPWSGSLIWKNEEADFLPESRNACTASFGFRDGPGEQSRIEGEFAIQSRDTDFEWDLHASEPFSDGRKWALAGYLTWARDLCRDQTIEVGGFYYSGDGPNLRAFRAPWGSWPKWSELYIYTLIGEGTPERVHVAAWENIAAGRVQWRAPVLRLRGREVQLRLAALYLGAPEPDWASRGVLTQTELSWAPADGWQSHLLWEMLNPGEFHESTMDDPVHFLRWQITYAFR